MPRASCRIGSRILEAYEQDAARAGFRRFELGANAAGERLYRVVNGASIDVVRMGKSV